MLLQGETHTYDYANRRLQTSKAGGTSVSFVRDALDRVVARTETTTAGSVTYRYGYPGAGDSSSMTLSTSNVVLDNVITLPTGAMYVSRGVNVGTWQYPDIYGNYSTANNGTSSYAPYGPDMFEAGVTPDNLTGGLDYGWHGADRRFTDTRVGTAANPPKLRPLMEMGARTYDPSTGRFLQMDPVEGGNQNDYIYPVDPVNGSDLTGMCWVCDVWDDTGGKVVSAVADAAPSVSACVGYCLEVGYSRESGLYAVPGFGVALALPSLQFNSKPNCGATEYKAFAGAGLGPIGGGISYTRNKDIGSKWKRTVYRNYSPTRKSVSRWRPSAGAGLIVQRTWCHLRLTG